MTARTRPALTSLPAYTPGRSVPGAIKLASNELSYPVLPRVAAAITEVLGQGTAGVNRYPDNGAGVLVARLARHLDIDPARVITGCGSVALCQQLVQVAADDGDEVIFGWRSFEAYPIVAQIAGAVPVKVPLTPDHALNLPAMAAAVTDRTRLIYVCTPNNPTGPSITGAQLEEFLDMVPRDILVVVDEAYREFCTDPDAPDGLEVAARRSNVVTLRTMSKAYGLAGLRVGYTVGDPAIITALSKVAIPFALSTLAQVAAVAALDGEDELRPRWAEVIAERTRVRDALIAAGYQVPVSQGNFVWLPMGGEGATAFSDHCAAQRVIVRPYGDPGGGARISVGAPDENDAFLAAALSYPR